MPSGRKSTATSKLLSSSLAGEFKKLHRQTSLKGGGRSTLLQERARVKHERKAWNQTSVTLDSCDSAVQDESRTSAVLATKPPHVSVHSSASGTKKRKRGKTSKKPVTPTGSNPEGGGGMIPSGSEQKKITKNYVSSSQSTEEEAKLSPMKDTVSPPSHLLPLNTLAHTGEKRDMEGQCRQSAKKRGRGRSRRLLTVRGRFSLTLSSRNRHMKKSFHPVLFHSRTDLLHPLHLRAVREEFAFLVCLQRELARKPAVG